LKPEEKHHDLQQQQKLLPFEEVYNIISS